MRKVLSIFALAVLAGACYPDRWTSNYDSFPDFTESQNAILDETQLSDEEKARRDAELRRWNEMPEQEYTINAGDQINVTVYDHSDLTFTTVVTPDGYIGMVFLGQVKVAGLTLAQAAKLIEDGLADYIKKPAVGISASQISSERVTITGAAKAPGMYNISNGMRLADLYALAGGSSERLFDGQVLDAADLVNSMFARRVKDKDGKEHYEVLPIDFRKAIEQGDTDHNVLLRKGDYVYIAVRSESMVCLIGDAMTPHKRIWDNNLGILELLTTGSWVKDSHWSHAVLIRGGVSDPTIYKIDIDGILAGKKPNVKLAAGDIVYLPKDSISEYNVFVQKLLPTAQLFNALVSPVSLWSAFSTR